jgi:hypothetical protein
MDGGDLVFQLHIADVTVATSDPTGQTVATATIPVTTEIARWHLATDELKEARDLHQLRLARAIHPVAESDEGKSEAEKAVEQQATADLVASIELRDIDADLSVRSTQDIPLNIDSPTVRGLIVLAPAAIIGLRATGGIEAWKQPKSRAKLPGVGGLRAVSIDSVGIKSTAFVIKDSTKVETGKITVSNVHDASVEIKGVYPPGLKTIDATIGKAIAEDIKWDLAYKPPPK